MIDLLDYICPSSLPITDINMSSFEFKVPNPNPNQQKESLLFLLNRFRDTLNTIVIWKVEFDSEIQDAITQCSHINNVELNCITFPNFVTSKQISRLAVSNMSEMMVRLATDFPDLVSLILRNEAVSAIHLSELINLCRRIEKIYLNLDYSF